MTDRQLVTWIIDTHEGRAFTDDKDDPGGATNFGITLRLFSAFMGREMTVEQLKAMPFTMAVDVLHSEFCFKPKLSELTDARVKLCAIDFAIHSSAVRAVRSLQYAAGMSSPHDGVLGPQTREAVNAADPAVIHQRMLAFRMRFISEAIKANPKLGTKYRGFWNRLANLVELPATLASLRTL